MRKQYYFLRSPEGILSWDVDRLIALSKDLPRKHVRIDDIHELEESWHGDEERPVCWRAMIDHIKLIDEADLAYPIILSASGAVMDGMHRVAKAARLGQTTIEAVQFESDPPPDHIGKGPNDLPYD